MGPAFETACDIEFEVAPRGGQPRWVLNHDKGYSGKWAEGVIIEITDVCIRTLAQYPDGDVREDSWPNHGSSDYEFDQWDFPGYLKRKAGPPPVCECGYGDDSGVHWQFCPRWAYLRR